MLPLPSFCLDRLIQTYLKKNNKCMFISGMGAYVLRVKRANEKIHY